MSVDLRTILKSLKSTLEADGPAVSQYLPYVEAALTADPARAQGAEVEPGDDIAKQRFELWFFRDILDEHRLKLLALFGISTDDKIGQTHGFQKRALSHILSSLTAPPAPQPTEITAQDAAKVLLDIYDNGDHRDFRSIVVASAFGSEAYENGIDRFQGTHAMTRAFLTAIADPSSTDLNYLRAKYQLAGGEA